MSIIQRIREKAAWFVFGIIALALLAFILQDSLMQSNRGGSGPGTVIGKVNGQEIDQRDFENKLDFYQQNNNANRDELVGSLWDFMVEQTVLDQQYKKLGLTYTSKELSDALFGQNPPQWMQQAFTNPETGVYDVNAAKQQFDAMKKTPNDPRVQQVYEGYINPTIQQQLRQKYTVLLTQSVYVPKWLSEKANADNNSYAKISFVNVPYNSINDTNLKVSDAEILAYMKKYPKLFEQKEETRQISYVVFNASATHEDSLELRQQLEHLKPEFSETTDVKAFLTRNGSELPYYESFVSKGAMKHQANDSLFNLSVNQVYGPYIDGSNYVLAKMVDKRILPDSVKVRHILVATHQPQQNGEMIRVRDDESAKLRLDSAVALLKSGVSWDSVAMVYSDDPGSRNDGGVYDYFPTGQMVDAFNDFAFTGHVGDKKEVQTTFGYHYIEILGQKGSDPAYKIAYLAKPITASEATINNANDAAVSFAATYRDPKKFQEEAAKVPGGNPHVAMGIHQNDFAVEGMSDSRQLVKWAFDHKVGNVSETFNINDNFVVAMLTGINKPGLVSVEDARLMVTPKVLNEKKAKVIIDTKLKGNSLEEMAKSSGTTVQSLDSVSFQGYVLPNVGNEVKIIGASFNKSIENKVSSPIAGNTGVFVLTGRGVFAAPTLSSNPETLRENMASQLKSQISFRSLNALSESADIKDYRSNFY